VPESSYATECPNALIANPSVRKAIQVGVSILSLTVAALVGIADELQDLGLLSELAVSLIRTAVEHGWPVLAGAAALISAANVPTPEIRRGRIQTVTAELEEADAGEAS